MKKNSQVHFFLETDLYNALNSQANKAGIKLSELIRRKLYMQPLQEEILLLRKFKELIKNSRRVAK